MSDQAQLIQNYNSQCQMAWLIQNYNSQCQMAQLIQITTQIVIRRNLSKLQLTMSDQAQLIQNYNSQCQMAWLIQNYNSQCQMAQLIQITAHNVRWHNLFKLQPTMSDGTTYSNYSPQCHDQMAKVIQMRLSE
jgi:hypothetical protein